MGADPARGHAGMACLDHHRDALGLKMIPDTVGDLCGQPFLNLKSAGKAVKHARQLGNSDHFVAGQISDCRFADDRCHVMFAMGLERNVLEQDDFVISADFLEHPRQMIRRVLGIARGIFPPRPSNALGRVGQPFAVGIVTGPANERLDRRGNLARNLDLGRRYDQIPVVQPS